jgi:tungstate transport system permease protein
VDLIWEGIKKAFELIWRWDGEVLGITWLTLKISGTATLLSLALGATSGMALALANFPGRRIVIALINTGMGLPPVVVGLWVTLFLWRNGPFGTLGLLYTPTAIVIAQVVIATPIIAGLSLTAIQHLPPNLRLQILSLGANRIQMAWLLAKEARLPLMAAIMAGFGGVVSEVGASIMVGGNIRGYTRVLTTATVMETGRGNFDIALALGLILLLLSFAVNALLTHLQQRERPR